MNIRFPAGSCGLCSMTTSLGAEHKTCEDCGNSYKNLCQSCADSRCPTCSGALVPTQAAFPHTLFRAIRDADSDRVTRLLDERSVRLDDLVTEQGDTPLSIAARLEDGEAAAKILDILLARGADSRAKTGYVGRTALSLMVWFRTYNPEIAWRLRDSVNVPDDDGRTALMYAAQGAGLFGSRRGSLTIARDLLALGADLSSADRQGVTALGFAIRSNDTGKNNKMIEFLQKEMVKEEALRSFSKRHTYHFNDRGQMEVTERQEPVRSPLRATRQLMPSRYRRARADATLGGLQETVEVTFGLPSGSVRLVNPDGRKLRSDATVGTLRKNWDEG